MPARSRPSKVAARVAGLFRVFSDPSRVRILSALAHGQVNVGMKGPGPHPARCSFTVWCLALALGLAAHLLVHTFVNPHPIAAAASESPSSGSAPSSAERAPAAWASNPDSVSVLPAVLVVGAPPSLVVFITAPSLVRLCLHWPPPLHPPQFATI